MSNNLPTLPQTAESLFPPEFIIRGFWKPDFDVFVFRITTAVLEDCELSGPKLHLLDEERVSYVTGELKKSRGRLKAELHRLIREIEKLEGTDD